MAASQPVVDVRRQPHTQAAPNRHDPFEETQLLYGERVRLLTVQDGWAQIEAIEQAEYTHRRKWQGYPGWVPAERLTPAEPLSPPSVVVTEKWAPVWQDAYQTQAAPFQLPLGTLLRATDMGGRLWRVELVDGSSVWIDHAHARSLSALQALSEPEQRRLLLRTAERFLGDPYFWGGRSPADGPSLDGVTGVDCSGLVNLSYRTIGLAIPRDAHEQFMRAQRIKVPQPGDLIFLSERLNPHRIVHVMLYAGDGQVIEGPGTGLPVRRIALSQRLGQSLDWLAPGTVVDEQTVFFGTYFE